MTLHWLIIASIIGLGGSMFFLILGLIELKNYQKAIKEEKFHNAND